MNYKELKAKVKKEGRTLDWLCNQFNIKSTTALKYKIEHDVLNDIELNWMKDNNLL